MLALTIMCRYARSQVTSSLLSRTDITLDLTLATTLPSRPTLQHCVGLNMANVLLRCGRLVLTVAAAGLRQMHIFGNCWSKSLEAKVQIFKIS